MRSRSKYTVFGLQRSGTNYVETYLEYNFPNSDIAQGYEHNRLWKHTYSIEKDIKEYRATYNKQLMPYEYWINRLRRLNPILVHKHPFMWVESIFKIDIKYGPGSLGMKLHPHYSGNNVESLAKIYKAHADWWRNQRRHHQKIYKIQYEDLLVEGNTSKHMEQIARFFGDEESYVKSDIHIPRIRLSRNFKPEDIDRYINYETKLSKRYQGIILNIVGEETFKDYGYPFQRF